MEISTSAPVLLETSYVGPKKTMHYSQTKTEWGCQQWFEELRRAVTCLIYRFNTHIHIKLHGCIIKMIIPSKEHELLQELTWAVTCLSEKVPNWHLFCMTGTPQYRQRGKEMPWYMQWHCDNTTNAKLIHNWVLHLVRPVFAHRIIYSSRWP